MVHEIFPPLSPENYTPLVLGRGGGQGFGRVFLFPAGVEYKILSPKKLLSEHDQIVSAACLSQVHEHGTDSTVLGFRTGSSQTQCQVVVFIVDDLGRRGPGTPDPFTDRCQPQKTCSHA